MAKKKIVILETDQEQCQQLISSLEQEGYESFVYQDVPQLMKNILLFHKSLTAIFINISAAPFGAVELCNSIRNLDELKHIPILLLADKPTAEEFMEGLDAGCIDVITYPINTQQVMVRLNHAVKFWNLFQKQQKKAKNAQAVAADSMEYSNYLSEIVDLSDRCSRITTYDGIAEAVFAFTGKRNLNASLICFGVDEYFYFASNEAANSIEQEMMLMIYGSSDGGSAGQRFKIFNNRIFACFDQSILLVKNATDETAGHLQDLMGSLMNIINAKCSVMRDDEIRLRDIQKERTRNLKTFNDAFERVDELFTQQTESIKQKIVFIESELSVNLAALDLGDYIENEIMTMVVGYFSQVADQVEGNKDNLSNILIEISEYLTKELGAKAK